MIKRILESDKNLSKIAADYLKNDKAIIFITDTVYGLAVNGLSEKAVENIYKIKKRDKNKPIAIFLSDVKISEKLFVFSDLARKIRDKFIFKGLTLVLKKSDNFDLKLAKNINSNDDFIGFRVVKTQFLNELFKEFSGVLAVTSANISGEKSGINSDEIFKSFKDCEVDILLVDSGKCAFGEPSSVIKVYDNNFEILREGVIKKEEIENEIDN